MTSVIHVSPAVHRTVHVLSGLLVLAVFALNVVSHPGVSLLLLLGITCIAFVFGHADQVFWAVVLLTPFETFGPFSFLMTKTVKLALTGLAACALYWRTWDQPTSGNSRDPYHWPFILILFSGICSTLLAKSPWTSLAGLLSICIFMFFYSAVRNSSIRVDQGQAVLRIVMWSGLLSSVLCITQLLLGYEGLLGSPEQRSMQGEGVMDTFWPGIERGSAAFNGPSAAGAFLAISAVIALTHAQMFSKSRAQYFVAGLLCIAGLLATFSRGALLGVIAGCAFASWTMGFLSKRRLWLIGGVAVLVLPALFLAEGTRDYLRLGSDLVSASESRVDAWQATRVILKNHPVFGIGFYEFRDIAQGIEGFSDTPLHPHNGFLKALVEQGPLGGCGYLLYIAAFLRTAASAARGMDKPRRWIQGAIAGAGAGLFTQELFDANLTLGGSSLAILFAGFLGLQASLCSMHEAGSQAFEYESSAASVEACVTESN